MSTKVLFVDDEKLERVLLRKGYDWERNGFEIIGEASSGEEALAFFDVTEPDIVFTDINMPYMDGLCLAEKIKERSEKCRVVIVTGYREFEYARRAVQLGVKDFVLKPVNIDEISELAQTIRDEQMQAKGFIDEYQRLQESASQSQDIVRESFLQRLVENRMEEDEALHKIEMYKLTKLLDNSICFAIKAHGKETDSGNGTLENGRKLLELIQKTHSEPLISFLHYLSNVVLFLTEPDLQEAVLFAMSLKHLINEELNLEVEIGISQINHGLGGISKAYKQADMAISASVILGRNTCITFDEYSKMKENNKESMNINWKKYTFDVENCMENQVVEQIQLFTDAIKKSGITDAEYLKLMTMDILSKSTGLLTKSGKNLGDLVGEEFLYQEIVKIENIDEMNTFLKETIRKIITYGLSVKEKKSYKLIEQSTFYIDTNLNDSSLTLKTVAKSVFTNESYLSRVFKKEVGESLIEYITRKRIEQSIFLLKTTDLKVYEIAERVGFSNPHYFSICFKKQVGQTIMEYKGSK